MNLAAIETTAQNPARPVLQRAYEGQDAQHFLVQDTKSFLVRDGRYFLVQDLENVSAQDQDYLIVQVQQSAESGFVWTSGAAGDPWATAEATQLAVLIKQVYLSLTKVSAFSRELPTWVVSFYSDPRDKASRSSLKRLISGMADLLTQRDFSTIDTILSRVDWARLAPEIVMGIARATAVARQQLPSWSHATRAASDELRRRGLPAEEIMMGLLEKIDDGSNPRAA